MRSVYQALPPIFRAPGNEASKSEGEGSQSVKSVVNTSKVFLEVIL